MNICIRTGFASDAWLLPDIERAAGTAFRNVPGLEWIADPEPPPAERYFGLIDEGSVWVAVDRDVPVGFLAAERVGTDLHIREVSVVPALQKQGIGRRLIERARAHAEARACSRLTLTTFRDVPWNAPFYARLGFTIIDAPALDGRLRALLDREADGGFPSERRCAMHLLLGSPRNP